jgi:hypothetical protein
MGARTMLNEGYFIGKLKKVADNEVLYYHTSRCDGIVPRVIDEES